MDDMSSDGIKREYCRLTKNFLFSILLFTLLQNSVCPHLLIDPTSLRDQNLFSLKMQNCGGLEEINASGEKCGVCGDSYFVDRFHLSPNIQSNSQITLLDSGSEYKVRLHLKPYRPGWVEFRICKASGSQIADQHPIGQDCFDRHILNIVDANSTRQYLSPDKIKMDNILELGVSIPDYLQCDSCILQTRYRTYDTINVDPLTGAECLGCGIQEIFQDCALIQITKKSTQPFSTINSLKQKRSYSQNDISIYHSKREESSNRFNVPDWMIPNESKHHSNSAEPDVVCMTREEYGHLRETVDMVEYLVNKIKHESLRELIVYGNSYQSPNRQYVEAPSYVPIDNQIATQPSPIKPHHHQHYKRAHRENRRREFDQCRALGRLAGNTRADKYCEMNCKRGICMRKNCQCKSRR